MQAAKMDHDLGPGGTARTRTSSTTCCCTSTAGCARSRTCRSATACTCSAPAPAGEQRVDLVLAMLRARQMWGGEQSRARPARGAGPGRGRLRRRRVDEVEDAGARPGRRAWRPPGGTRPPRPPSSPTCAEPCVRAAERAPLARTPPASRHVRRARSTVGGTPAVSVERVLRFAADEVVPRLDATADEIDRACCTPSTAGSSRPGRPARRCAGWSTCCRPAATSTPSTRRPCRRGWPGRPARRWPSRWSSATGADHGEYPQQRRAVACGAPARCAPPATTSPRCFALLGVRPVWDEASRRVAHLEVIDLDELGRPRIDVTVRISGFFRDAFPHVLALLDDAVQLVAALDEPRRAELRARTRGDRTARRRAPARPGSSAPSRAPTAPGCCSSSTPADWRDDADLAEVYTTWGGYAYGRGLDGVPARDDMEARLPADRGGGQEHRHPRARHRRLRRLLPVPRRHGRHRPRADRHRARRVRRRLDPSGGGPHPHACTRRPRACSAPAW